ncbi:MAG TPA: DUF177 domain-containing protein [Candidatus Polarisedimenticolaceae bacterium]|nr:DUF177 domain-containing protein [Candidatus Polarisedimenticolaceae bacterium]
MQVDVSDILRRGEGAQEEFIIDDETPGLEGLEMASPINGTVRIIGTSTGVLASGKLEAAVMLECSRCLKAYAQTVQFRLQAEFEDHPDEEQFLIDRQGKIDLAEPLRQELEVRLPLKALCQDDCTGIKLNQMKDS